MTMNAKEIVEFLDGPAAAGRFFGVKAPSVMGWLASGEIPEGRLIARAADLERLPDSPFSRRTQFPGRWQSIWPELVDQPNDVASPRHTVPDRRITHNPPHPDLERREPEAARLAGQGV